MNEDCAPFTPQPRHIIAYHFVTLGHMQLVACDQEPIDVRAGELVVLPRNDIHLLGSDMSIKPADISGLIQPGNAVLSMLPGVLKLDVADAISGTWIESAFHFGAKELAELLFMDAVFSRAFKRVYGVPPAAWRKGTLKS